MTFNPVLIHFLQHLKKVKFFTENVKNVLNFLNCKNSLHQTFLLFKLNKYNNDHIMCFRLITKNANERFVKICKKQERYAKCN